jgi:Bacterial SH3 domain
MRGKRCVAIGAILIVASIVAVGLARAQSEGAGPPMAPAPAKPPTHRTAAHPATVSNFDIEEASARLKLMHDTPIYASPTTGARHIQPGTAGKYVQVTGVTRHWLRVKLKSGATGYVQQKDVQLLKPADKLFTLTKDAAVLAGPNPWAKKLAEVHRGHSVHVTGMALNYMKIRMRSGLQGYIRITALE